MSGHGRPGHATAHPPPVATLRNRRGGWRAVIELTWEIPRQSEAVGIVRRDVSKLLADWGMERDAPSVAVIISELLTNALQHGAGTVTLCLARHGEGIRGAVSDHGSGTPRKSEAAGDAEHGRGLAIVDAYTTAWGVHPLACGGKQVWFDYKPAGRPA